MNLEQLEISWVLNSAGFLCMPTLGTSQSIQSTVCAKKKELAVMFEAPSSNQIPFRNT